MAWPPSTETTAEASAIRPVSVATAHAALFTMAASPESARRARARGLRTREAARRQCRTTVLLVSITRAGTGAQALVRRRGGSVSCPATLIAGLAQPASGDCPGQAGFSDAGRRRAAIPAARVQAGFGRREVTRHPVRSDAAPSQPDRPDAGSGRRRAAGIYGAVITASVLAAAGGRVTTVALAVSVIVTLVVYWLAEQYAELLGEQAAGTSVLSRATMISGLARTWPIVSASAAPIAVLLLARLAGASAAAAANAGIVTAVVLLAVHGFAAGRAARLHGWRLTGVTVTAAALGLVMVVLKNLVLLNLH